MKVLTMNVPNFLSLLRLAMVPVFAVVFFQPFPTARYWAAGVYALAFVTDVADGYIARHFNQITRLGRILDPLADKEAAMGLGALSMLHKIDDVIPSNWLGKISTFVFFVVCAALVLFPQIPRGWATGMISFALALTILAFLYYLWLYVSVLGKKK